MRELRPIPFDSLNLYAVLHEHGFFAGGRIQEIRQPDPLTIVVHLYMHRTEHRLLISADAQHARMHCISTKMPNAPTPPPFSRACANISTAGLSGRRRWSASTVSCKLRFRRAKAFTA